MSDTYFVRLRGRLRGPLTRDQLMADAQAGVISQMHSVSEDQQTWRLASELPWLFPAVTPIVHARRHEGAAAASPPEGVVPPAPPAPRSGRRTIVLAILAPLLTAALVGGGAVLYVYRGSATSAIGRLTGDQAVTNVTDEARLADAVGLVISSAQLTGPDGRRADVPRSQGSGFMITGDGYMLTNRHVVQDYLDLSRAEILKEDLRKQGKLVVLEQLWVFLAGHKYPAKLVFASTTFDMAILKIDRKGGAYFVLSDANPSLDTEVRTIGFPTAGLNILSDEELVKRKTIDFGDFHEDVAQYFEPRDMKFILTSGHVSQTMQDDVAKTDYVRHNAQISSGSSGGPLVSTAGLAIGINTLYQPSGEGAYYALGLHQLKNEIDAHVTGVRWAR